MKRRSLGKRRDSVGAKRRTLKFVAVVALSLSSGPLKAQPVITNQPASQAVWPGSNVMFTVAVAGVGPFAYNWQFNGTNLPTVISTIAGPGSAASLGDGGAATNAYLNRPQGVGVDLSGALLIADPGNNRIRRIDLSGVITTVAGNGSYGYTGDGGFATNAALRSPSGVALGTNGAFYIADTLNSCIRMVDTNGIITSIAGNGTAGYSGDGTWATNASLRRPQGVALDAFGNLYIADTSNNRIRKVDRAGIITTAAGTGMPGNTGDGGVATNAALQTPGGVAVDSTGNLFIADTGNYRIRKVDTNGIITRVAGAGLSYSGDGGQATNAGLNYPSGVTLDAAGNVYIADTYDNRIRKVDSCGVITTVAGRGPVGQSSGTYSGDGGPPTSASLNSPYSVALDVVGNFYIVDQSNRRIREVGGRPSLTLSNVTAGNVGAYAVVITNSSGSVTSSVATLSLLGMPVIVSQPANQSAWAGSNATFAVSATGSPPLGYQWHGNDGAPIDGGTSALLLLNKVSTNASGNYTVVVTNSYGSITSSAAALIVNELATQPTNQTVVAGETLVLSIGMVGGGPLRFQWQCNGINLPNNLIRTVAGISDYGFSGDGGSATNALLDWPGRIEFDRWDSLFIADCANGRIRRVDTNGIITTVAGNGTNTDSGDGGTATDAGLYLPNDVAWDAAGNLYIGDYQHVRKVDTNGIITTATAAVHNASGMAMDGLGRLYIAQFFANIVSRLDPNRSLTTVAGGGTSGLGDGGVATQASLNGPSDVLLDAAGNLYIADSVNHRVRKVDTYGIITTVAGNGQSGYSGDGGPATAASLYHAQALALDAQGNLFIADSENNRVREVDTSGIITTVAGNGSAQDTGDGGAATDAGVSHPWGITFDSAGNLFFSTSYRVREVGLAGSPTYVLHNISVSNAGAYRVIITSPSGSVTSQVVTVTVLLRPSITSLVPQPNGTMALNFTGTPNSTNRVWITSDLTPPAVWAAISTNVAGADGSWQCSDSNTAGCSTRFYRASMP